MLPFYMPLHTVSQLQLECLRWNKCLNVWATNAQEVWGWNTNAPERAATRAQNIKEAPCWSVADQSSIYFNLTGLKEPSKEMPGGFLPMTTWQVQRIMTAYIL